MRDAAGEHAERILIWELRGARLSKAKLGEQPRSDPLK